MQHDCAHLPEHSTSGEAAELLDRLDRLDAWSASALKGVLAAHADLLNALSHDIHLLLNAPEGMEGVCPPITREDWEQTAAQAGLDADSSDEDLAQMNAIQGRIRGRVARAVARRNLRRSLRREFTRRGLRVPPLSA